ncbi:hypothetical protein [Staphylococcus succinus]|uniref:hypothetical protein n=1 Tax=Staphylococcus succinus TaxID=61015 RepID=UPI00301BB24E
MNIDEEIVKIRYTVKFEKDIPCTQRPHETREDMIERIGDKLFYDNGEAIDGRVLDIDDIEEM